MIQTNPSRDTLQCSVIVPVFNHWHLTPALIDCIARQTIGTGALELLLVDNDSDELPDNADLPVFVRLLRCETPGSYAARNVGITHARGQDLAFTDADCRPDPRWLEHLLAADVKDEALIVAGALRVTTETTPNRFELYELTLGIPQHRYVKHGYGATANLLVPRVAFEQCGPFDATRYSGGDAEFCRRAARRGFRTQYCANAVVCHPARNSLESLASKIRRIKGGQITAGPVHRRLYFAARTLLPPVERWVAIFSSRRLTSPAQRLAVFSVQCRLWLVEIAEMIRLCLGAKPARR